MLVLQDPSDPESYYLNETISSSASGAIAGGCAFAYATASGIKLLLESPPLQTLATDGDLDLVVGVDEITDSRALATLADYEGQLSNLSVSAFLTDTAQTRFHPKVSWFSNGRSATVVVGSGNLTVAGLSRNWEAYGVVTEDARTTAQAWEQWKTRNASRLRPLNDPAVIASAEQNKQRPSPMQPQDDLDIIEASLPESEQDVLIAEIPRGATRWNQANFDKASFVEFFNVRPGADQWIVLWHVSPDGTVGDPEIRPGVAVKSHNYRFELGAAAGRAYPTVGRPIAVFVKSAPRRLRYLLLLPGDHLYNEIEALLTREIGMADRRMRRLRSGSAAVRKAIPGLPI